MHKLEIKFGIYGGLAVCLFKAIEFLPVFQKARIESGIDTGLLALVVVAGFVIWGVKAKRSNGHKGGFTFLRAFVTGMTIALFMALITIPCIYVYGKFINPTEDDKMIDYITINQGDYPAPTPQEIHDYYAPRHRSMQTGENMLLAGFIVSLFSAGMFRRVPVTEEDFIKDAELPSFARKFFVISILFTVLPFTIYILWLLESAGINTVLFDFITGPIDNPLGLQEGTAFLSLVAFMLNIISYNKLAYYGHSLNVWNMRMVIVSIASFLISLWLILH